MFNTLSATLGSYYVNDFNKFGRTWQVLMSAEPRYRNRPDDIGAVWVRSKRGEMVPLSALAKVSYSSGPDSLDRFNNLPAVKIIGQGAPGVSSGQAIERVETIAREVLPKEFSFDWGGASYQEKKSSGTSNLALGMAVIMVFLILAALYERWSLPFSVLLALPFGTFGALTAVWIRGMTNDVYFQIGLVTLLGLAAKNAILIVEYALLKTTGGLLAIGRGDRGGEVAIPADHHDLARVHPRRGAARFLDRRRSRRAGIGRYRCDGRHAGGDVPRDLLHSLLLQVARRAARARDAQRGRAACRSRGGRAAQRGVARRDDCRHGRQRSIPWLTIL